MEAIISSEKETAYIKLYNSASCTSDYRFNTYRRLSGLEGISNFSLITASTSLIVVSFILGLYKENLECYDIYITIGQNCLPIIMLALSILVSSEKYGARAQKIHDCAQDLNNFRKLLKYHIEDEGFCPSSENFEKYLEKYSEIIAKHENHSKLDSIIEMIRGAKTECFSKISKELMANLIGRGLIYYFYLLISIAAVAWMCLVVYWAVKGGRPC